MGDMADMMLDGLLDSETGELIDGDAPGYPRTVPKRRSQIKGPKCPDCGKRLRSEQGVKDHQLAVHGGSDEAQT